jgi:2-keto-4-pentenoate hydratase/2-oxohepta-3-ene-1,7-dioic acid hydratase in catechol pathway
MTALPPRGLAHGLTLLSIRKGAEVQIDPDDLAIECRVNGETRQSSSTSDLIFGCGPLVSYVSRIFTLRPGDLIFTGTPEGVIQGKPKDQRVWLGPGDRIACSVEKLGELTFTLT